MSGPGDGAPKPTGPAPTLSEASADADAPASTRPRAGAVDLPVVDPSRYEVVGEHGRGGLGRVLAARDRRLERLVAVKRLSEGAASRADARFVREALVTARLQHPGIVPVYEAGRLPDGEPFYSMRLVKGQTLAEALGARPSLDERLALLPNLLAVAEAVAYAHSEGVVHRDLKPANVLVGPFGETVVVDWGLAKDRRLVGVGSGPSGGASEPDPQEAECDSLYALAHADKTRVGAVIGTPAYMPPEQARGDDVDERADVYALGAILYELLCAEPPYAGASAKVLAQVASAAPPALATRAPGAPRDVIAIVAKAMARRPDDRYPSAKELADDLSRFLTGQLVGARRYGRLTLVGRWLRRHRGAVAVAAVLLAALATVAGVSARRIVHERDVARRRSAELILTQARSQLDGDPTTALAWLKQYPADGAAWDQVRVVAADAASRGVARQVLAHEGEVDAALFTPDGQSIVTTSLSMLRIWDAASGVVVAEHQVGGILALALAERGQTLVLGGADGTVRTVPITFGAAPKILTKLDDRLATISVSRDGQRVVAAARDGSACDCPLGGAPCQRFEAGAPGSRHFALLADGGVVSLGADGRLTLRPGVGALPTVLGEPGPPSSIFAVTADGLGVVGASGRTAWRWRADGELVRFALAPAPITTVAVAADGRVATGSTDGQVLLWSADGQGSEVFTRHDRGVSALAFSPDDTWLASADERGGVELVAGGEHRRLAGHRRAVRGLVFAPDGRSLLSSSEDGSVRRWDVPAAPTIVRLSAHSLYRALFVGDMLATTGQDGALRLWRPGEPSTATQRLGQGTAPLYDLRRLGDAGLVAGGWDGSVWVWSGGGEAQRFDHGARIWDVSGSPDGKLAASAGTDGAVRLWDVATGQGRVLERHDVQAIDVVFSPDGTRVASSGGDNVIRVRTLASGQVQELRGHTDNTNSLTFDTAGEHLYSASWDGTVRAWTLATGEGRVLGRHGGQVRTLALAPDGKTLASGGTDNAARLWPLAGGGAPRELRGHENQVRHVTYSPDGVWLASAGWDNTVRLWRVQDDYVVVLRGHSLLVQRVAFSADGRLLASVSSDGTVGVWSMDGVEAVPAPSMALQAWLAGATNLRVGH
jgi:WD40 repeat protein